jgi:hypothetical protein
VLVQGTGLLEIRPYDSNQFFYTFPFGSRSFGAEDIVVDVAAFYDLVDQTVDGPAKNGRT